MTYFAYERLSNRDDESMAIERQHADNTAEAQRRGWEPLEHVVDNASAWRKRGARPGFNRLLSAINDHAADGIIVWDIDRLFRRNDELEQLIEALDNASAAGHPVQVVSSGSSTIDLNTSDGRVFARLMVTMASKASADTSRRIKRALADIEPNYYGRDPHQAEMLRKAARHLLDGGSVKSLTAMFAGERGVRGGRLVGQNIVRLLRNQKVRPILGDDTFRDIAVLMSNPRRNSAHFDYLLSGRIYCEECSTPMAGHANHRPGYEPVPQYACSAAFTPRKGRKKCYVRTSSSPVEELVLTWIRDELAERVAVIATSAPAVEAADIQRRISELADSRFLHNEIDHETWRRIDGELRAALETLTVVNRSYMSPELFEELWAKGDLMARRALIARFVEGVFIARTAKNSARTFQPDRVTIVRSGTPLGPMLDLIRSRSHPGA